MTDRPRRLAMINSDGKTQPALADPEGVETTMYDLRLKVMARTAYDHLFTELGTLDAAEAALQEGCDALYIDTFGDYGAARIRACTSVPVIGAGEASIAAAARALPTYSVVTVWPRTMAYLYDERLRECHGGKQCSGVHYLSDEDELDRVGKSDGVKARMVRHENDLVEQLVELCHEAVARDRTDGVLLGCTCMSPIAGSLQERCAFAVMDPSRLGLEAAFQAVLHGGSERLATTTKLSGMARSVVSAYLGRPDPSEPVLEGCPVCAVAQATGTPSS